MSYFKLALIFTMFTSASLCEAALGTTGPVSLSKAEDLAIESLKFQTGCARPDLSDSNVDGSATIEITFNESGKPISGKIVNSNGSDSDNQKIVESFTKRCNYTKRSTEIPYGAFKQFTYRWKAKTKLTGVQQCMIEPYYPAASVRLKEEGITEASYRYLPNGSYDIRISKSSGSGRLDDTALSTFKLCLDNQAINGEPDKDGWEKVLMTFKLAPANE